VIARPQNIDVSLEQDGHMVSPELVLVDPALASWAREHLPERPETATRVPAATLPPVSAPEPPAAPIDTNAHAEAAATARPRRRRKAAGITLSVLIGLASAAALVYLGVRSERGDASATSSDSTRVATPPPAPAAPAGAAPATRRFAWAPRAGASGYHVELFKGPMLVFRANSAKPEIVIPKRWRLNGRVHTLVPGSYRWYVWPRVGGRRQARAIVQARLILPTR